MSQHKQLIIICLLALVVTQVSIPEVSATAPDTRVRIEPAHLVVGLNETFVVRVVIEEANDLGAFQFDLAYDLSILQVTEAALGDFLGSTGRSVVPIGPEVNNAEGRVTFGAISFGSGSGPSGTGVLATITCIAQREGDAALGLRQVQVLNTAASVQRVTVEGGQVVVRSAKAPAPTATSAPAAPVTPVPTSTPKAADTPVPPATALPSPTPIVTSPTAETPTETPPTSPTPSVSIAPTETKPTKVTTPLAVPTVEAIKAPAAATATPTSPPSTPPPPVPSPTPLATMPVPAAAGPPGGAVLGLMLAALAVAILAIFILSRRPGG